MPQRKKTFDDTPDDLSPEWTEENSAWAVKVADFGDPVAASQFLLRRERIFRAAEAAGISREMLTPFAPNKPGFEARVETAFRQIASAAGMAAE